MVAKKSGQDLTQRLKINLATLAIHNVARKTVVFEQQSLQGLRHVLQRHPVHHWHRHSTSNISVENHLGMYRHGRGASQFSARSSNATATASALSSLQPQPQLHQSQKLGRNQPQPQPQPQIEKCNCNSNSNVKLKHKMGKIVKTNGTNIVSNDDCSAIRRHAPPPARRPAPPPARRPRPSARSPTCSSARSPTCISARSHDQRRLRQIFWRECEDVHCGTSSNTAYVKSCGGSVKMWFHPIFALIWPECQFWWFWVFRSKRNPNRPVKAVKPDTGFKYPGSRSVLSLV